VTVGPTRPSPSWPAVIALVFGLMALDQASKFVMLDLIFDPPRRLVVTDFFWLSPVWNRGVSFGLLASDDPRAPYLLFAFAVLVAGGMAIWLARARTRLLRIALALVIAGALGNAIDRILHGAVVDFLDFHYAGAHFPAFNLADSAITIGVGLLLMDSFLYKEAPGANGDETGAGRDPGGRDGNDA